MDRTARTPVLLMFAAFMVLCLYGVDTYAGKAAYQCKNSDGTTELTDKGCQNGAVENYYSSQQLKDLAGPNRQVYLPKSSKVTKKTKTTKKRRKTKYPEGYASSSALKKACGKKFDGVNSINLSGLKRSLKIRQSKHRIAKVDGNEIVELKCRIARLEKVR